MFLLDYFLCIHNKFLSGGFAQWKFFFLWTPCRKATRAPIMHILVYSMIRFLFKLFGRQHWFVSRLNDASVTAGGFPPKNSNTFVVTTASNEIFELNLKAKKLGEWSKHHSAHLPRAFQEFPGEIIGLSFLPFSSSTSAIVYSARYDYSKSCSFFNFV